jgi:lipoprotein-anchoring transpeptidase ErfK/SrfK
LVIFAGVGIALAAYPYPPVPTAEVESARIALQEARRGAGPLAPEPLARAEAAALVMERLYAQDRSRWFRFQRLESLDRAIDDTRSHAAEALAQAREVRSDRSTRGAALREELQAELHRLEPAVGFLPPSERRARSAVARAELALSRAAAAHDGGDLDRMEASLEAASRDIAGARAALDGRYRRFHEPESRRRWQAWADETVAASRGGRVSIVVDKLDRHLYLFRDGRVAARFHADLGRNALADKLAAGDGATPEGRYRVTEKRANGSTQWYKALLLDYPNADDWKTYRAMKRRGEISPGRGPGGLIEIHGQGGKRSNWTDGCVALPNPVMDKLFAAVPVGTPVTIVGTAQLPGEAEGAARKEAG